MEQVSLQFKEMSPIERKVWFALSGCHGKGLAVKQKDLAKVAGISSRSVREAVHSLITNHFKRIGSSYDGAKGGNYLIQNQKEAEETAALMLSHAKGILQRVAVILDQDLESLKDKL